MLYVTFSFEAGLSKDILLFLGSLFGLLLNLLRLFLNGLGYLLHDDLFDLLLERLCVILNSFRHLLLDRFEHLGNDLFRYWSWTSSATSTASGLSVSFATSALTSVTASIPFSRTFSSSTAVNP